MDALFELRPIRFFSFYLAFMFALSTYLRWRQYHSILLLVIGLKNRWPNLTNLVLAHRHIFLTWPTIRPLAILLILTLSNWIASSWIFPQAQELRVSDLFDIWPVLLLVVPACGAMVAFDTWGVVRVGSIDRKQTEDYFDQAERWLRGWRVPVVRIFSLGFVDPRRIVAREVRTALEGATEWLNSTLWWVNIQTGLRITFGLSLWASFALEGVLRHLLGVG